MRKKLLHDKIANQNALIERLRLKVCPDGHHYREVSREYYDTNQGYCVDVDLYITEVCTRCERRKVERR